MCEGEQVRLTIDLCRRDHVLSEHPSNKYDTLFAMKHTEDSHMHLFLEWLDFEIPTQDNPHPLTHLQTAVGTYYGKRHSFAPAKA
jgi:hypothetical protein